MKERPVWQLNPVYETQNRSAFIFTTSRGSKHHKVQWIKPVDGRTYEYLSLHLGKDSVVTFAAVWKFHQSCQQGFFCQWLCWTHLHCFSWCFIHTRRLFHPQPHHHNYKEDFNISLDNFSYFSPFICCSGSGILSLVDYWHSQRPPHIPCHGEVTQSSSVLRSSLGVRPKAVLRPRPVDTHFLPRMRDEVQSVERNTRAVGRHVGPR